MNRSFLLLLVGILLVGCQSAPEFTVSGVVSHAEGKTIYLEHTGLLKTTCIDSCLLDAEGVFQLQAPAPSHPDFYHLRVGQRSLALAVDSIETITVRTSLDSLPYTLSIEGSPASLTMAKLRATARTTSREVLREKAQAVIISNPRSLAAYYAVFLKQGGEYIWNIFDSSDRRLFQAVATSFHTWMPNYERTTALYNQVMEVLQAERSVKNQQAMQQFIADADNAFLDITLPDEQGDMQSLSSLRGDVIILDFSSTEMERSVGYMFELRELYNKYHHRGLEIYSVSLDGNQLVWEQSVENLPWTTVRLDPNAAASVLMQYNVQGIPTLFLLDREGNVQGRYIDFKALDTDIKKYL